MNHCCIDQVMIQWIRDVIQTVPNSSLTTANAVATTLQRKNTLKIICLHKESKQTLN